MQEKNLKFTSLQLTTQILEIPWVTKL